ncbi:hypothetical protein IFM89_015591 [Coptis chinensis]|uniref:Uncharacterized protein n=1 Tax=Coptis chinensis TaxID=261450 RepID=A0A835I2J5_9MAGN|nr:hypothetical protein IFM89_015591 [Coptis chinensis]
MQTMTKPKLKRLRKTTMLLEQKKVIAELEVAAEEDVALNELSKPAMNKLKKLPLLTQVLLRKPLQHEFLDHDHSYSLSSMQHAVRPKSMAMDFVVRPLSKIKLKEIRARAGQIVNDDQWRLRVSKNLQNLKSQNKRPLQAMKLSVEGR